MLARMCSNGTTHSLQAGVENGLANLGGCLAVSYKTNHTLNIQSSSRSPWNLLNRIKNMSTQKPAHGCLQQLYS